MNRFYTPLWCVCIILPSSFHIFTSIYLPCTLTTNHSTCQFLLLPFHSICFELLPFQRIICTSLSLPSSFLSTFACISLPSSSPPPSYTLSPSPSPSLSHLQVMNIHVKVLYLDLAPMKPLQVIQSHNSPLSPHLHLPPIHSPHIPHLHYPLLQVMNIQVEALSLDLAPMKPLQVIQSHYSAVLSSDQLLALTNGNASFVSLK